MPSFAPGTLKWFCSIGSNSITLCYCDDMGFVSCSLVENCEYVAADYIHKYKLSMRHKYKQSMRNFLLWLDLTIPGAFHTISPYFS